MLTKYKKMKTKLYFQLILVIVIDAKIMFKIQEIKFKGCFGWKLISLMVLCEKNSRFICNPRINKIYVYINNDIYFILQFYT